MNPRTLIPVQAWVWYSARLDMTEIHGSPYHTPSSSEYVYLGMMVAEFNPPQVVVAKAIPPFEIRRGN